MQGLYQPLGGPRAPNLEPMTKKTQTMQLTVWSAYAAREGCLLGPIAPQNSPSGICNHCRCQGSRTGAGHQRIVRSALHGGGARGGRWGVTGGAGVEEGEAGGGGGNR